jgi:hypothetical protein
MIGCLKGGSKGSTSRIYKWCHQHTENPIACVFSQVNNMNQNNNISISSWNKIDITNLDLGIISGNIGTNGLIVIGGSNGGQLLYSTNLGNNWSIYPNSPNLPSFNLPNNFPCPWSSVVMSDNTNYVLAVPYFADNGGYSSNVNNIYFTTGFGTWGTPISSCRIEGTNPVETLNFYTGDIDNKPIIFACAGITQDGSYMAVLTEPRTSSGFVYLIFSNNYGSTWQAIKINPFINPYIVSAIPTSISLCNASTNYFLITSDLNNTSGTIQNGTCCVSSTGNPFTVPSGISGNDFVNSSISDNGQYQVFVTATNINTTAIPSKLYLSTNYGSNFNPIITLSLIDDNNYQVFGGVSMSSNGKYITASVFEYNNSPAVLNYLYISSNYGSTWKKIYNDNNGNKIISGPIESSGPDIGFLNSNFSGQYQMFVSGANIIYINNNYGN